MTSEALPPLLSSESVLGAVHRVRPAIEGLLVSNLTNREFLWIVVTGLPAIKAPNLAGDFEDTCWFIGVLGNAEGIEPRFRAMALSKAERTVRTGRPTAELSPHYLQPGDTTSWGSVVLDDIVVACCGVQSHYDEMFAMWVAAAVKAEAKQTFEATYSGRRFV